MTKDEKLAIAWIALDGLISRSFADSLEYDSTEYDDLHTLAFGPYIKFLNSESVEHDLLLLIHLQNLAEKTLMDGNGRLKKMKPATFTDEIVRQAREAIHFGKDTFGIFTSYSRASRIFGER